MSNAPTSRRAFLSGWVALGAVTSFPSSAQTTGGYLIGCYTRPWDAWELDRALDGVAEAGYRWVGLMTAKGKSWVIITPDTTLFEGSVKLVQLPGIDGSFEILTNHAPLISVLGEGKIKVQHDNDELEYFEVKGGVIEVLKNKILILAE